MSHEIFEPYRPNKKAAGVIARARSIIEEYQTEGLVLTLRQLYYQFVSRDLIPNTDKSYKRLGTIIAKARMSGFLPWDAIEDRVRRPTRWQEDASASAAVRRALKSFRLPRLMGQPTYVELWVEKDALAGVLEPIAAEYHVTLMVNRGYSSVSAMKEAGDRIRWCCNRYNSDDAVVLYLGDFDPSGEDMVRDIRDRLEVFVNNGFLVTWDGGGYASLEDDAAQELRKPFLNLTVEKLALTMPQVREYDPPPNPAKLTDSRAKAFIAEHGPQSWEVDALPPPVLHDIIRSAFEEHLDTDLLQKRIDEESADRKKVRGAVDAIHSEKLKKKEGE